MGISISYMLKFKEKQFDRFVFFNLRVKKYDKRDIDIKIVMGDAKKYSLMYF